MPWWRWQPVGRYRPGDIWRIGSHRLICGDSTESETYQALLASSAPLVFTDPALQRADFPGTSAALARSQHREFAMASGDVSSDLQRSCRPFSGISPYSVDGSIHFQCMDWRHLQEMLAAGGAAYRPEKPLRIIRRRHGFTVPVAA